jgi:hypothetical protein
MKALMLLLTFATLTVVAQRGVTAQTGVLAGQLNTPEGRPAAGIRVAAMAAPEPNAPPTAATSTLVSIGQTDASGRYRLEGIPAGRYYIVAGQVGFPTYYPGVVGLAEATPIAVSATAGPGNQALNFALSLANQDGAIEVTVTSAGVPLRGAQLTLRGPNAAGAAAALPPMTGAVTDDNGNAAFRNLSPGQYSVSTQLDGYLGVLPSGLIIVGAIAPPVASTATTTISPRQPPQKISLVLNRGAAIGGTITDTNGTPIVGMRVSAVILNFANGRRTLGSVRTAQTDDRGQYRLFWFGQGEYYIVADPAPQRGLTTQVDTYPSTYYPGTSDLANAKTVVLRNSDGASGIDFKVQRVRNYRVTGKVVNSSGPVPSFAFAPRDPDAPDSSLAPPLMQNRTPAATGEFDILVPPGEWNLFAVIPQTPPTRGAPGTVTVGVGVLGGVAAAAARYITGRAAIDVVDKDIEGVTITLNSSDVKGRVIMPASGSVLPNGITLPQIRAALQPKENIPAPLVAGTRLAQPLGPNGDFTFPGVPAGKYGLVMSVPTPAYIADIRVGAKSIFNDGILTVGTDPIDSVEVILASGAGSIQGTVTGITPETTVGQLTATRIVLAPAPPRRQNALLYRTLPVSNLTGSFFLGGIAPGEYKLFAFGGLPAGAEQDPAVLARYEDRGKAFTITAGQNTTQSVQVDWIPNAK